MARQSTVGVGDVAQVGFHHSLGTETIEKQEQAVAANPGVEAGRAGLAASLCWLDRQSEADAILEEAASAGFEHIAWVAAKLAALALYADTAAQTHNVKAAEALYECMTPFSELVVWAAVQGYGHVRLWLGLLGVAMAVGLARILRSGGEIPEEYWRSLVHY